MSYDKTNWNLGDIITSTKMMNIEDQIESLTNEVEGARGKGGSESGTLGSRIDDMIIVSNIQPTKVDNEIWFNSTSNNIQIPTYEEFEQVVDEVARVSGDVNDIQCAVNKYNAYDYLRSSATYINRTHNGITFTWNADHTACTLSGTATATAWTNIFDNVSSFPEGMIPGNKYYIKVKTTNPYARIVCHAYFNNTDSDAEGRQPYYEDGEYTLPENATGFNIRVYAYSGYTYNNAIVSDIAILDTLTNKELDNKIVSSIDNVKSALIQFTPIDVLKFAVPTNRTSSGVTFAFHKDGSCTVTGTASALVSATYYTSANSVPDWIVPGNTYIVKYSSTNVSLQIYPYYDGTIGDRILNTKGDTTVKIPENISGLIIRLTVSNGVTVNETVNPCLIPHVLYTNNFLASTNDNSDRTADIMLMLSDTGACHLGAGVFYVSGVDMPDDTTLEGSGSATEIILIGNDNTEGYAIKVGSRCIVRNLSVKGNTEDHTGNNDYYSTSATYVSRHGLIWQGNFSTDNDNIPRRAIISGLCISNFSGGGITCVDTGTNVSASFSMSDTLIWHCYAGINIQYSSEYNRFANVAVTNCLYGVINNGGNNLFTNCNLSNNNTGVWMDDTNGESPNNSHGSFVGCAINHSGQNSGYALILNGLDSGEIFSACQIFYGRTQITDCKGIRFIGCNFGRQTEVSVSDSCAISFDSCQFRQASDTPVSNLNNVGFKFVNCMLYDGNEFMPLS